MVITFFVKAEDLFTGDNEPILDALERPGSPAIKCSAPSGARSTDFLGNLREVKASRSLSFMLARLLANISFLPTFGWTLAGEFALSRASVWA